MEEQERYERKLVFLSFHSFLGCLSSWALMEKWGYCEANRGWRRRVLYCMMEKVCEFFYLFWFSILRGVVVEFIVVFVREHNYYHPWILWYDIFFWKLSLSCFILFKKWSHANLKKEKINNNNLLVSFYFYFYF